MNKIKKTIFTISTLSVSLGVILPFAVSCSSNSSSNINVSILSNKTEFLPNEQIELTADVEGNNIPNNLSYEWTCSTLDEINSFDQKSISFQTSSIGNHIISLNIKVESKIIASSSIEIVIKEETTPQPPLEPTYSLSLTAENTNINVNESITINSNLTVTNGTIPSNLTYKWEYNGTTIEEINKKSINFSTSTPNTYTIKLTVLDNGDILATSQINIVVNNIEENLVVPTKEELNINGDVKAYYFSSSTLLTSQEFVTKLNEYGIINSMSLLCYMMCDSPDFINSNNYEDISIKILKNDNYDDIKFEISAKVKSTFEGQIENVGKKLPFASIREGLGNVTLIANDTIKLTFELKRLSNSSYKGKNEFNPNQIRYSGITTTNLFVWNKINGEPSLAFTSDDFDVYTEFYKNNNLIKSGKDNRLFVPFIYYVNNEYSPTYNGYYLGQTKSIK